MRWAGAPARRSPPRPSAVPCLRLEAGRVEAQADETDNTLSAARVGRQSLVIDRVDRTLAGALPMLHHRPRCQERLAIRGERLAGPVKEPTAKTKPTRGFPRAVRSVQRSGSS